MAPTTRAASKRQQGGAPSAQPTSGTATGIRKSKAKKPAAKAVTKPRIAARGSMNSTPSRFLALPAELRNRIYEYAAEPISDSYGPSSPRLLIQGPIQKQRVYGYIKPSTRTFFPLTQANKQIRAEYRPIWMRNSSVQIMPGDFLAFMRTFFPTSIDSQIAPKLLQIAWNHDQDYKKGKKMDITVLLKLRARCPTLKCEFVRHTIAHVPEVGSDPDDLNDEEFFEFYCDRCVCFHYPDYGEEDEDYSYLWDLNTFLANANELWLGDIREERIEVEFTLKDLDFMKRVQVYIYFKQGKAPSDLDKKEEDEMKKGAKQYLADAGLCSSEYECLQWAVGIVNHQEVEG